MKPEYILYHPDFKWYLNAHGGYFTISTTTAVHFQLEPFFKPVNGKYPIGFAIRLPSWSSDVNEHFPGVKIMKVLK
jgi:hypothetical protein